MGQSMTLSDSARLWAALDSVADVMLASSGVFLQGAKGGGICKGASAAACNESPASTNSAKRPKDLAVLSPV